MIDILKFLFYAINILTWGRKLVNINIKPVMTSLLLFMEALL